MVIRGVGNRKGGPAPPTALTETPSYPFRTFFQPTAIQTASNGETIGNEATLFHEALHGISGLYDFTIVPDSLESVLHLSEPSVNITNYIQKNVLSVCPVASR